ncbi:MAG: dTMP kinase [Clostridiales bacterium]|nr:dTMP kinase [Clostridiales bacterium]
MSGLFISFEGNDGAGKSTQAVLLKEHFLKKGFAACLFREPGGSDISEKIREIILDNGNYKMKHLTEAYLYAAARCQLVYEKIMPALKGGQIVICDRFLDSSLVYQGIGRGLGISVVEDINKYAVGGLKPDLTFFLHLNPSEAIDRHREERELDRMENQKAYFHNRVYRGFLEIAEKEPNRIIKVEANRPLKVISEEIAEAAERFINERGL